METRNLVEGYFSDEFPVISDHLESWRPELAKR